MVGNQVLWSSHASNNFSVPKHLHRVLFAHDFWGRADSQRNILVLIRNNWSQIRAAFPAYYSLIPSCAAGIGVYQYVKLKPEVAKKVTLQTVFSCFIEPPQHIKNGSLRPEEASLITVET